MDEEQFSKLKISLDRTLKETQAAFNDCFMIVSPELGTA